MHSLPIKMSAALFLLALGHARALQAANVPVSTQSDHQVVVTAVIDDLPNGEYVHFFSFGDGKHDSVLVQNHRFTFTKELVKPDLYLLWLGRFPTMGGDESTGGLLFLEPGAVQVTGEGPFFKHAVITGPGAEKDWQDFRGKMLDSASVAEEARLSTEEQDSFSQGIQMDEADRARLNEIHDTRKAFAEDWIKAHPNSPVSAYAIEMYITPAPNAIQGYLDRLENGAKDNYFFDRLSEKVKLIASLPAIGKMAKDFTQNDVNGQPVTLSSYRGKYVLVDFWASWCKPCRAENPNVKAAYERFKDKNFTVLGVSLDEDKGKWIKAIETDQLPWTQVSDLGGFKNAAAILYGVQAIPSNVLIGPDGTVLAVGLRGEDLERKLAEVLK